LTANHPDAIVLPGFRSTIRRMGDLGRYLASGRERAGLSTEQVAKTTRIPIRFIEAIEGERLDELPGPVYARGFVSTCCRALGLDESPAMEMLAARLRTTGGDARREGARTHSADILVGSRRASPVNWAYLVIALVFVVGILVALLTVGTGGGPNDVSRVRQNRGADWTEQLPARPQ